MRDLTIRTIAHSLTKPAALFRVPGRPSPLSLSLTYPAARAHSSTMKSENTDVKHFQSIPWCRALLEEPNTVRETASSRFLKPSGEDTLFATVLNTPDTIKAFLALYRLPPPSPPGSPAARIDEACYLITLGRDVAGYPEVCHGGIVTTILDEIIGLLLPLNKGRNAIPETAYMTGYLNTSFLKPVTIPGTYVCRATIDKVEGRKYYMTGTIEDSTGAVAARGDALYIALKEKL